MQRDKFIGLVSHVAISRNNRRLFTYLNHSRELFMYLGWSYIRDLPSISSYTTIRLSQCLNFSLESVRALYASTPSFLFLPLFLPLALPWKKGQRGCLSAGFDGTEHERKRYVRKAQKGGYLATKLFYLMLVADVAQSILKELRERKESMAKSSDKFERHFAKRRQASFSCIRLLARFKRNSYTGRHGGEAVCSLPSFLRQIFTRE